MKKKLVIIGLLLAAGLIIFFVILKNTNKPVAKPKLAVVKFPVSAKEKRIEQMHARVFKQLGGYKGPEACYACHQKEYLEISHSYHAHQGRITADGKIAYDPSKAADLGMFNRWYSLSNTDRVKTPENQWRLIEGAYCSQCHPGGGPLKQYGMDVDCLICHQQNGYKGGKGVGKAPAGVDANGYVIQSNGARLAALMMAGAKANGDYKKLDLSGIAAKAMEGVELRIGKPRPDNCNFCHWKTNSKRGTRYAAFKGKSMDVHYSAGMLCQDCHITKKHQIGKGKVVDTAGTPQLRGTMKTCTDCHGEAPHEGDYADELNDHVERIACETCHIPKTTPATVGVDWLRGMDMVNMMKKFHWMLPIANVFGMATPEMMTGQINDMIAHYKKKAKAGFKPVYAWHNRDILCTEVPHPTGSRDDDNSRITPFNVIETVLFDDGTTPAVVKNPDGHANGYPVPRTFVARAGGKGKRDTTLEEMRKYDNGRYKNAVIRRIPMYFSMYHNIAPAKEALSCNQCHTQKGGRLDFAALGYDPDEIEDLTENRE